MYYRGAVTDSTHQSGKIITTLCSIFARFFAKEARKVAVCRGVGLLISVHKEAPVTRIGCPLRELLRTNEVHAKKRKTR